MEYCDKQIEIYAKMSPKERIQSAFSLHDFAHNRMVLFLEKENPEKSHKEILKLALERFINESTGVF